MSRRESDQEAHCEGSPLHGQQGAQYQWIPVLHVRNAAAFLEVEKVIHDHLFYIIIIISTTAPAPHLDGKHVVFGRVVSGYEVVEIVENTKVDKNDRRMSTLISFWNLSFC